MTIFSKIWAGFIIVAAIVFFYMGARTLKTHETYRANYNKYEKLVDDANVTQTKLREGGEATDLGIRQAKFELHWLLSQRGRVWTDCLPSQPNESGHVDVAISNPNPHQIRAPEKGKPSVVVYAFDQKSAAEQGRFMGEFKVTKVVNENTVSLQPAFPFGPDRAAEMAAFVGRLQASAKTGNNWVLHDVMPVDDHETFAGMQPGELDPLFPPESVDDYKRDNGKAEADDPAERVLTVDGEKRYQRPLRDYAVLYREYDRQYTLLRDEIDSYNRDNAAVTAALADAEKELVFADMQITEAKDELAQAETEKKTAEDYLAAVQAVLEDLKGQVASTFEKIQTTGKELAALQLKLIEDAERRAAAATAQLESK